MTDAELLDELRGFAPLPDDDDDAWRDDATWARVDQLVELSKEVAARKLVDAVGLLLDAMPLGDVNEAMCSMHHGFEEAANPDWPRLAAICVTRCESARAGTRFWACEQLGRLREATALPALIARFEDPSRDVAAEAIRAAGMTLAKHPSRRDEVLAAARRATAARPELAGELSWISSR